MSVITQERKKDRIRYKLKQFNRSNRKRIYLQVTNRNLMAQLIDDQSGKTLATVSTVKKPEKGANANRSNRENAVKLADLLSAQLKSLKISEGEGFVFDRGAKSYHGKVAAFVEKLRENGIKI